MAPDSSSVEQAVSRALRDNLDKLQRTTEELHQAVADLVAACASSRPTNALPPIVRAQTAAAALAASLDVLSRFITAALQPAQRTPAEEALLRVVSLPRPEPARAQTPPAPSLPVPMAESPRPPIFTSARIEADPAADMIAEGGPIMPLEAAIESPEPVDEPRVPSFAEALAQTAAQGFAAEPALEPPAAFNLSTLPLEEQELHRRANRVAKVSMQDIQMMRPNQVRLGREHKDLCVRLRDDIEKARKEYDRRFHAILDHPVDYFYRWVVEILANGDPEALGEYPYPSPVLRR